MILFFGIPVGCAVAQYSSSANSVLLPEIQRDVDIQLSNLFAKSNSGLHSKKYNSDQLDNESVTTMRLIGTLIMGEKKLAMIITNAALMHLLETGQRIPGSSYDIQQIRTDSVELIETDRCIDSDACNFRLMLNLD